MLITGACFTVRLYHTRKSTGYEAIRGEDLDEYSGQVMIDTPTRMKKKSNSSGLFA